MQYPRTPDHGGMGASFAESAKRALGGGDGGGFGSGFGDRGLTLTSPTPSPNPNPNPNPHLLKAGKYKTEGKEYVVKDGDIIFFKFNVTAEKKK